MSVKLDEILEEYSAAITSGSAEILIGAGLSQGVGYPGWDDLLEGIRAEADVPPTVLGAPVVAEYVAHELTRDRLESRILTPFETERSPGPSHWLLGQLADFGLQSVWTTNYDTLLEKVFPNAYRVFRDDDYSYSRKVVRNGRLTKIHGSIGCDHNGIVTWLERPTITRSDYEEYQREHPILWAELQARFLTNSFLFLGFSFNDPNIEVLLHLSRSLNRRFSRAPHFAIMRRERDKTNARLQDLRVMDLERSGIAVAYIGEFKEIEIFLQDLRRRVLPPTIFVSGGRAIKWHRESFRDVAKAIQDEAPRLALISMGSAPSYHLGSALANLRRQNEVNDPELIRFYYRRHEADRPVPHPKDRTGTAVYTDYDREGLLSNLLDQTTAFLEFGNNSMTSRSTEELARARQRNIPCFVLKGNVGIEGPRSRSTAPPVRVITVSEISQLRAWLNEVFANTLADRPRSPRPPA